MASNTTAPKYAPFKVLSTTYKTVHNHPISVYVLIPKSLLSAASPSQQHPLIVKFHGGFLVTGDALYEPWFPDWLVQYVQQHNAIVVLPNHRLIPEASGLDIAEDMHDFWTWVKDGELQKYLASETEGVQVDLSKVLVTGESAGGYLSIQAALGGDGVVPTAVVATYPVLDISSRFYTEDYEKVILGAPTLPKDILADHIKAVEDDSKNGSPRVVTSANPPDRLPFALSIVQQGLYKKLLGDHELLDPFRRIETVKAEDIPPILVIHGRDDSAVPVEGSEKWVDKGKGILGKEKVELIVQPGEHGFDSDPSITLETPWLKDGLVRITEAWLGQA